MSVYDPFIQYASPLRRGDRGPRVSELQRGLNDSSRRSGLLDYGLVGEEGEFGARTEAAVRSFQRYWKLEPNGIADGDVQKTLFLARTPLGRFHDLGLASDRDLLRILTTSGFVLDTDRTPRPVSSLTISRAAKEWMFFDETGNQTEVTAYLHYPGKPGDGNKSGVTLGPGYDLGYRKDIAKTLTKIGVDTQIAQKVEKEAPILRGQLAKDYADKNGAKGTQLIHLTKDQQIQLQDAYLPSYEVYVKQYVSILLMQHEYEALVSFAANPGGSIVPVTNLLNRNEVAAALDAILRRVSKKESGIYKGLMNRRRREVQWFLTGRYTP